MTKPIIFFDGVCNLCNRSVLFVIRHDPQQKFRFSPLQGETARKLLPQELLTPAMSSIVLLEGGKVYSRSTAALRTAAKLRGPVKLLSAFLVIPSFLRNVIYNLIARNRYKWFGRKDACMIPTPEVQSRFLP